MHLEGPHTLLVEGRNGRDTSALYTRVATTTIRAVISPLDRLGPLTPKKDEPK